jgi:hypothetical protein
VWALTLNVTAPLLHPVSHSLMQLYIATRAYSPTLELYRTLRTGPSQHAHTHTDVQVYTCSPQPVPLFVRACVTPAGAHMCRWLNHPAYARPRL